MSLIFLKARKRYYARRRSHVQITHRFPSCVVALSIRRFILGDFERINRQQPGTENILGHLLFFIVLLFAARSSSSSSRVLPTLAPLFLAQRVLEAQRWAKLSNEFACRSPNDFLLSEERTRPSSRSSIKEMTLNKVSPVPSPYFCARYSR